MTVLGALKSMVCGGWRGIGGGSADRAWQNPPGTERLNGEKEKLRQLCATIDEMKADMERAHEQLDVIVSAIREAPEQERDHCAACPLRRMKAGLVKKKRGRSR